MPRLRGNRLNSRRTQGNAGGGGQQGGGAALWAPQISIDLYGGLAFYGTDPADGAVSSWVTHEGLAHAATQATGSAKPTKGATGVVFDGGDSLTRSGSNPAKYVRSTVVPDDTNAPAGKGGTCTGLCRAAGANEFWMATHGIANVGDLVWRPELIRFSYVNGVITKLQTITLFDKVVGIESVQGITLDTSDGTLWFASATAALLLNIYHIQTDGTLLGDTITPSWAPNGIAYVPADDALWICEQADTGNNIEKRSCVDGSVLVAAAATGLTNIDMLHYDASTGCLLMTYGANGAAGNVRVFATSGASGALVNVGGINLPAQCDAVEGIVWEGNKLYVLNDARFHIDNSRFNELIELDVVPPMANVITVVLVGGVSATTTTDCFFELGDPIGANGFGLYPTSTTGLNVFANTGASGTTQQGSIVATGLPNMNTSQRVICCIFDVLNDLLTLRVDGTEKATASLSPLVGGITTAQNLRISTAATGTRNITGAIKRIEIVTGAADYEKMEGEAAWATGLQANLDAAHPYKNAAPRV